MRNLMIVKMKKREQRCIHRCEKYKNWDYYIVATESYMSGYKDALLLASEHVRDSWVNPIYIDKPIKEAIEEMSNSIINLETDETEIEFKDGEHQLNVK